MSLWLNYRKCKETFDKVYPLFDRKELEALSHANKDELQRRREEAEVFIVQVGEYLEKKPWDATEDELQDLFEKVRMVKRSFHGV